MLSVSPAFTAAINNPYGRHITMRFAFYFDPTPVYFTIEDYIVDASWTEELFEDETTPIGRPTADTLYLLINNTSQIFRLDNITSPYYGKIKEGLKIIPFLSVETSPGIYEEIQLKTYYVVNWIASIDSTTANITCCDRMLKIFNSINPSIPLWLNRTREEVYSALLSNAGENSYTIEIDSSLATREFPYYFNVGLNVADNLLAINELDFSCTYIKKSNDKVCVAPFAGTSPTALATWDDSNQIFNIQRNISFIDNRRNLHVRYVIPSLQERTVLLDLQNFNIFAGTNTYLLSLDGIVRTISSIVFAEQTAPITLNYIQLSSNQLLLTITCSVDTTAHLTVEGITLGLLEASVVDESITSSNNYLDIGNNLIQFDYNAAMVLGKNQTFLARVSPYILVECLGDPSLEVLDTLSIGSAEYNFPDTLVVPVRFTYTFDGALSCTALVVLKECLD